MPRKRLLWGKDPVPRHGVFPLTGNSNCTRRVLVQRSQHVVAPIKVLYVNKGAKALA